MKIALNCFFKLIFLFCVFNTCAQNWSSLGSGVNNYVHALTVYNSNLIVAGRFTIAGGNTANNIIKWNGTSWSTLSSGLNGIVFSLTTYNSELCVGGSFSTAGGIPANGIAAWNETNWLNLGAGMQHVMPSPGTGIVYGLSMYNSELYAGGSFSTADGNWIANIARWNGSNWLAVGGGLMTSGLSSLTVYNNELFATGGISDSNNIAKWDGINWSAVSGGLNDFSSCAVVYNNELYVGGIFTEADGSLVNYIAKWNGTNWSSVGSGTNDHVYALAVYNGELYAGGRFTQAGGNLANHIAKWDGSNWSALGTGTDTSVYAMTAYNGDLYVGGTFTQAGGNLANYIAKWNNPIGIKDLEINNVISIYPNPTNNELYVQSSQLTFKKEDEPYILDLNGKQIFIPTQYMNANTYKLDASALSAGIYFLVVKTEKGVGRKKLVIEK